MPSISDIGHSTLRALLIPIIIILVVIMVSSSASAKPIARRTPGVSSWGPGTIHVYLDGLSAEKQASIKEGINRWVSPMGAYGVSVEFNQGTASGVANAVQVSEVAPGTVGQGIAGQGNGNSVGKRGSDGKISNYSFNCLQWTRRRISD